MKIRILGSLSGTEPFPERNHTSWVLELDNGSVYWFDAGENCSRTAYLAAVDILNTRSIFISHPHYDHFGGLINVFTVMKKMRYLDGEQSPQTLKVYYPFADMIEPFDNFMKATGSYPGETDIQNNLLHDGDVIENDEIKVEVRGNCHIAPASEGAFKSFSFRITAENKTIVYSGDIRTPDEIADWTQCADAVLMESGHHKPFEVCAGWKAAGAQIGQIIFMHHGRTFLDKPVQCKLASKHAWGREVLFAEDNTVVEL